jgi:hypothetical protein
MKLRTAIALISLLVALLGFWSFSYFRYGVIGREAYSGIGTELISVQGKLILWKYNSYQHEPPPQDWGMAAFPPESKMGNLLQRQYDFSAASKLWNRLGFVWIYIREKHYGPTAFNLIVSLPYWLLVLIVSLLLGVIAVCSRQTKKKTG